MLLDKKRVQMIKPFLLGQTDMTASEIARSCNLNQKTTYTFLERLEEEGILTSARQGKNKLYRPNNENKELLIQFSCAVEHLRTMYFYQKHPAIKQLLQKLLPHIQGIAIVFGSYASGTQRSHSDIDLFISGTYNAKNINDILATFHKEVNIKYQKNLKDNPLIREIKSSHIILLGAETWIRSNGA